MRSPQKDFVIAVMLAVSLVACGDSDGPSSGSPPPGNSNPGAGTPGVGTTTTPVTTTRDGVIYAQAVESPNGDSVMIQVFEPKQLVAGQTYPLVLHGHGYGGKRETAAAEGSFIKRLIDAGYYVISIDQRGFGASSGTVRVMSPDFEGVNLVAVLDFAEGLEGLRRGGDGQMVVGSYGGSYGGMYQFLLMGADAKHRLHVIAPDITPHDLTYALNSGNVVKSGYGLALSAGAEASPRPAGPRQDPAIYEILINAIASGAFNETASNFFKYHSVNYFCAGQPAGAQNFMLADPDPLAIPPTPFPRADALITQGFRDTLFNFNDAFNNYQCLKALGGDVRLLTHQSGHILPVSLTSAPGAEEGLDPFYAALTLPNFQDVGGARDCGTLVLNDVQFAWFEEKLQNKSGELDKALPTGQDVCLSLAANDAIAMSAVKSGGLPFEIDASTPQFSSVLGVGGGVLGNGAREQLLATQTIMTVPAGGAIIAGLPTMSITLEGLSGLEMGSCAVPLNIGGCDPILLLAIGHRKAGAERWDVIDDQLTPIRGFGLHEGPMSGIAERLAEGDQLGLLIYGFHAQYPVTWSRDIFVPAVNLSGSVSLPLPDKSEIKREGV